MSSFSLPENGLTHLCLASYKWDTGKQCRPRSDTTECGVWSGFTLFALSRGISVQEENNKNYQTPLLLEMGRSKEVR